MKKIVYSLIIYSLFFTGNTFAGIAVFNPDLMTLDLPCVRLNTNGSNGNECYHVNLKFSGNVFEITGAEAPFVAGFESTDQIFYAVGSYLDIPYVQVAGQGYSAQLSFDAATSNLSLTSVGAPTATPGGGNTSSHPQGTCTTDIMPPGIYACAEFFEGSAEVSSACVASGGTWIDGGTCPENYSFACKYTENSNFGFNDYYYNLENASMDLIPPLTSECKADGGIPYTN